MRLPRKSKSVERLMERLRSFGQISCVDIELAYMYMNQEKAFGEPYKQRETFQKQNGSIGVCNSKCCKISCVTELA